MAVQCDFRCYIWDLLSAPGCYVCIDGVRTRGTHNLLVKAFVCSGGDNVVYGADALHVVFQELPDADRVFATFGPKHLMFQGVGGSEGHRRLDLQFSFIVYV